MPTREQRRLLDTANKVVPIELVCGLVGISLTGGKAYCPQQVYHSGPARTFRVYPDTNSGWCFGPCGYFTPVSVYTAVNGGEPANAAQVLLDHVGHRMVETLTFWISRPEPEPDRTALALALTTWADRAIPDWAMAQFDPEYAHELSRCLDLLPLVRSSRDAEQWLGAAKSALARHDERISSGSQQHS